MNVLRDALNIKNYILQEHFNYNNESEKIQTIMRDAITFDVLMDYFIAKNDKHIIIDCLNNKLFEEYHKTGSNSADGIEIRNKIYMLNLNWAAGAARKACSLYNLHSRFGEIFDVAKMYLFDLIENKTESERKFAIHVYKHSFYKICEHLRNGNRRNTVSLNEKLGWSGKLSVHAELIANARLRSLEDALAKLPEIYHNIIDMLANGSDSKEIAEAMSCSNHGIVDSVILQIREYTCEVLMGNEPEPLGVLTGLQNMNVNEKVADLPAKLRELRIASGKTVREVAKFVDRYYEMIYNYENGANKIPKDPLLLQAFADCFGVALESLVGENYFKLDTLGERLTYLRQKMGKEQHEVAKILGIGKKCLAHYEKDFYSIGPKSDLKHIEKLANYYGVPISYLIVEKSRDIDSFGIRIKKLREKAGIAQNIACVGLGMGRHLLGKYENGTRPMPRSRGTIENFARYYNVSVEYLQMLTNEPGIYIEKGINYPCIQVASKSNIRR